MKPSSMALGILLLGDFSGSRLAEAQATSVDEGVDAVEVLQTNATVEKIDLAKRKVSLLLEDGKHKTFRVDSRVTNLDQVKAGDHLSISLTEEIVMVVGKLDQGVGAAEGTKVSMNSKGVPPSVVRVDTSAISAKILAVDPEKHRITIEDTDGKKKTVKLSKKAAGLDQLKAGDTVDMVVTDSLVVKVVK